MRQCRVLVVEDDNDLRLMMEQLLSNEGYQPLGADNGSIALKVLKTTDVDLILLDLMMPVMDGWSFRRAQVADPAVASIPVFVVSAVLSGVAELGASAVFQKPLDFDHLLQAVAAVCPSSDT